MLAQAILHAADHDAVRGITASAPLDRSLEAMESLAGEVLRLMRTDARRALDVADRTVVIADALGDDVSRARATWIRAHGLSGVLRNRDAARAYETAASLYRALGDRLQEAKVAIGWINALMYVGEYAKAVRIGTRARDVFVRRRMHPEAARISMNLGNVYNRLERRREALREYDRSLRSARRLADPVMIRVIQFNRANALKSLGKLEQAERLYRDVREEALADGETRTAGFAEYSLGALALQTGEYARAYAHLDASRAVFEELDDAHYHTLALTGLAELFVEINAYARARTMAERAGSMAESHGIGVERARCALLEGIARLELDERRRGSACLRAARATFRREKNRVAAGLCALYLAELDRREGRLAAARRGIQAAIRAFEAERLPLRQAAAYLRLAEVDLERRRCRDARDAVSAARRALSRTHSPWLRAKLDHVEGRIARTDGRLGAALRAFRAAVRRTESLRGRVGIDEFRVSFGEDKAPIYADLVHALLRSDRRSAVAEAFQVSECSRARSLVELLAGRIDAAAGNAAGSARLMSRLRELRSELNWWSGFDAGATQPRDEARLRRSRRQLRRCEEEIADTVGRLRARDGALASLTGGDTTTLEEVRGWLGRATLVEYHVSAHGTVAFVITRDGARVVQLGATRESIEQMLTRLRFHFEKCAWGDEYTRSREEALLGLLRPELRAAGALLWEPLGVETKDVVLVPHGPLHSLPFYALVDSAGASLVERHTFRWLPSASVHRHVRPRGVGGRRRRRARVLAVGAGDASIPRVEEEVRHVRSLFDDGRVLSGSEATRDRLFEAGRGADVLHVATHGVFRDDDPHFSSLQLSDGWLSLYDLYGLRLDATLVCLSACQSGRSWVGSGDEIVGLARGFLHAGARNLLVSLWPVHDDSTMRLMTRFYGHLRAGVDATEALPAAMRELRDERYHPYYWAPFVLVGSGGRIAGPARLEIGDTEPL